MCRAQILFLFILSIKDIFYSLDYFQTFIFENVHLH